MGLLKFEVCSGESHSKHAAGFRMRPGKLNPSWRALETPQGRSLLAVGAFLYVGVLSLLWASLAGQESEPLGGEGATPHRWRRRLTSEALADNDSAAMLSHPLPNCNLYNYQSFSWTGIKTKEQFPNRVLGYSPRSYQPDAAATFGGQGQMVFAEETVYMVDALEGSSAVSVVGLRLKDLSEEVYTRAMELQKQMDKIETLFSFSIMVSTVKKYLKPVEEVRSVLAFDRVLVNHLTIRNTLARDWEPGKLKPHDYLAWTELDWSEEEAPGRSVHNASRRVVLYDLARQFAISMDRLAPADHDHQVVQSEPALCNRWLAFQQHEALSRRSSVWLYDTETRSVEVVGRSSASSFFSPHMGATSALHGPTPIEGSECRLVWLETAEELEVDKLGRTRLVTPTGGASDCTIRIMELPLKTWNEPLFPREWQAQLGGVWYSTLVNVLLSVEQLFVLLRSEHGNSWVVRRFSTQSRKWHEMPHTTSSMPLALHSASDQTLVYFREEADGSRAMMAHSVVYVPAKHRHFDSACLISDGTNVSRASIFEDLVLWQEEPSAGGLPVLLLLDLNKDNDHLPDTADRFPFTGEFQFDSDNDDIGDEGDFIRMSGPCTRSSTRGACMSDNDVLYMAWAVYGVCVAALSVFIVRWYKNLKASCASAEEECNEDLGDSEDGLSTQRFVTMSDSSIRIALLVFAGQMLMLVTTLVSVVVASIPFYETSVNIRTRNIYIWVDFFITVLFFVDLAVRAHLRDRSKTPGVLGFLRKNWTDCLALFTDVPGVTGVGALSFLVLTRFRHAVRLIRMARILKIFRVVRLYRRFMQHNFLIELMINRPTLFLLLLMCVIVLLASAAIKILEQSQQERFRSFPDVVWFTVVTITTVGYGDMVPHTIVARCITVFLMVVGIGILGLLTATLLKTLLTGGKGVEKLLQQRRAGQYRVELLQAYATRMAVAYNPMVTIFGESYEKAVGGLDGLSELHDRHQSAFIGFGVGDLATEEVLPIDQLMTANTGGKMGRAAGGGRNDQDVLAHRRRVAHQRQALRSLISSATFAPHITPQTKLVYLLKFFRLDEGKEKVVNFERFTQDLTDIIFQQVAPFQLFLEKVMCLHQSMDELGNFDGVPDLQDPLDSRLVRMEEVLKRNNVHKRADYHEIMLELTLVVMMFDRVQNARWAISNLQYRSDAQVPPPPFQDRNSHMCTDMLVPDFTFLSRRGAEESIGKARGWSKLQEYLRSEQRRESSKSCAESDPGARLLTTMTLMWKDKKERERRDRTSRPFIDVSSSSATEVQLGRTSTSNSTSLQPSTSSLRRHSSGPADVHGKLPAFLPSESLDRRIPVQRSSKERDRAVEVYTQGVVPPTEPGSPSTSRGSLHQVFMKSRRTEVPGESVGSLCLWDNSSFDSERAALQMDSTIVDQAADSEPTDDIAGAQLPPAVEERNMPGHGGTQETVGNESLSKRSRHVLVPPTV